MTTCKAVGREMKRLVALPSAGLPEWVRRHASECPACRRRLAAARLARGLVGAGTEASLPPPGFADRVRTALADRSGVPRPEADVWRTAWGLMPAFAAAVAALFIVYQTSEYPGPNGLFSTEGLSAGEYLLLGSPGPEMEDIIATVLEGGGK